MYIFLLKFYKIDITHIIFYTCTSYHQLQIQTLRCISIHEHDYYVLKQCLNNTR